MSRITSTFKKKEKLLFFLILNIVLFFIYTQNVNRPSYVYATTVGNISRSIFSAQAELLSYLNLKDANNQLREENERLRNQMSQNFISDYVDSNNLQRHHIYLSEWHSKTPNITLDTAYTWVRTNVIQKINRVGKNFLLINSGSQQGASEGMLVAGSSGIVGAIVKIYPTSALVMTMYHENFRLAAKVRANGSSGILEWNPNIPKKILLKDISARDHVWIGDTVFSSHLSSLAPPNIPIGRIQQIKYDSKDILQLTVTPIEKTESLYTAYIIVPKNKKKAIPTEELVTY